MSTRLCLCSPAKPTRPELTVPVDVTENFVAPVAITCKAKVGRPAGSLVLSARNENEADFRELIFNEQSTTPLSCTTEVRGIFYPKPGTLSNGSSISCHVVPHETLSEVADRTASVSVFKVIPGRLVCLSVRPSTKQLDNATVTKTARQCNTGQNS